MADSNVVARPAATSWGAVLGGWVATIGASVIFAPLVAGLIAAGGSPQNSPSDTALAVPVVLGILLSYIVGGYVAGRMAGYRTSWHGMMTAFFTLFVLLVILLIGGLADSGMFAGSGIRSLSDVLPGVRDLSVDSLGNALSFGAILGFLAAIFGGWLGGLLAPSHSVYARVHDTAPVVPGTRPAPVRTERDVVEERSRPTLLPAYGRKGGERALERRVDEVHTQRVERDGIG
jgi:hypothetical protein